MRNRELNVLFTTVGRIGEGTDTFLSEMQDAGPAWDFMKGWSSGRDNFRLDLICSSVFISMGLC